MKRSLAAAALAGVIGLVPLAGHASTAHAFSCTLGGSVAYDNPVGAIMQTNNAVVTGPVVCYDLVADTGASSVNSNAVGGDYQFILQGGASCTLNSMGGTITMTFGQNDTRDVWNGTINSVGALLQGLNINIVNIQHQTQDSITGDWTTTSEDSVNINAVFGHLLVQPDDPTQCAYTGNPAVDQPGTVGFTSASIQGGIRGAINTEPSA
ncbi:MAG: hypothetical protein ACYDCC_01780 [Actinomycetota bacterium]